MIEPTDLTVPLIPVDHVADLFSQCMTEPLRLALTRGSADPALGEVTAAIIFFNELKDTADQNDGLLPAAVNDQALDKLLAAWRVLRELGFLR